MQNFLFIKMGKKYSKINFSDIMYAEAVKKYVRIVTPKKVYLILSSMGSVERSLPGNQFCRIHRSYIISLHFTTDFDNEAVYIGDKIFPLGKQHKGLLHEKVIILSGDIKSEFAMLSSQSQLLVNTFNGDNYKIL